MGCSLESYEDYHFGSKSELESVDSPGKACGTNVPINPFEAVDDNCSGTHLLFNTPETSVGSQVYVNLYVPMWPKYNVSPYRIHKILPHNIYVVISENDLESLNSKV